MQERLHEIFIERSEATTVGGHASTSLMRAARE
jgi:hypothetical protein